MKRTVVSLGLIAMCLMLAVPASAGGPGWHIRVFAAGIDPNLDETVPSENPDEVRIQGESDLGFGASLEYQFNDRLGLELGAIWASPDVELSADVPGYGHVSLSDAMSTRIITLDLDVHLTPNSRAFDVYLGAGIASVDFDDLDFTDPEGDSLNISTDGEITWSVQAGVDIALGSESRWAAFGGLRYIDCDIELANVDLDDGNKATLPYDIFSFSVGIAYRF